MAVVSFFSCSAASLSFLFQTKRNYQLSLSSGLHNNQLNRTQLLRYDRGTLVNASHEMFKSRRRFCKGHNVPFAVSEDQPESSEIKPENCHLNAQGVSISNSSYYSFNSSSGKPGQISFYNGPNKREDEVHISGTQNCHDSILWYIGPAVLVASFVFPSLYLRRILSSVFEDSLLTDFLILFFTEALFYFGVGVFLLLIDHLRRPNNSESAISNNNMSPQFGQRISSVAALVLSLIIPMVTMGYVWPWTGPAASATLAPYLVGIVVQFAFEQYARYKKSPSWSVIPVIFQVYRLHQLNRAAQLVTALSFTIRGAEMTSHNMAINSSLGMLLNVLQCLGVICIWSLSSFLMRFIPTSITAQRHVYL